MSSVFGLFPSAGSGGRRPATTDRHRGSLDGSGGAAFYSGQRVMGAETAVDEINKAGGIMGRPVKLVKQDDGNNPNVAPIRTRALIEAGASGVLMTSGSGKHAAGAGSPRGDEGPGSDGEHEPEDHSAAEQLLHLSHGQRHQSDCRRR